MTKQIRTEQNRTEQMKFWEGTFGDVYIDRYSGDFDRYAKEDYGVTRTQLNKEFLSKLDKNIKILEIGCNSGGQLALLKRAGFNNLFGIEINKKALRIAKESKEFNVMYGSALDIPYEKDFFDLVFTSYVLIHIHPKDLQKVIREAYRVTKKYIWGIEYFSEKCEEVNYRGYGNKLWRNNFLNTFLSEYPALKVIKTKELPYRKDPNSDMMYLLKKKQVYG